MLSILCVRLTIQVKVGMPESFKVGWYPPPPQKKKTWSSHLIKTKPEIEYLFVSAYPWQHGDVIIFVLFL